MKKLIVLLVAACFAVSAHAQLGVVAGLTSTKNDFKELSNWKAIQDEVKNATLFHVGLTYKIKVLGDFLAIQPSLIYNMKGTKIGEADGAKDFTAGLEAKTGYLELPVQIQAGIGILGVARIYALAEPFVGYAITNSYKVGGSINIGGLNIGGSSEPQVNFDNLASRLEYGVSLGAGVEIAKHLQVSAKYFWNLGNVYDFDFNKSVEAVKGTKAGGIIASVAVLF